MQPRRERLVVTAEQMRVIERGLSTASEELRNAIGIDPMRSLRREEINAALATVREVRRNA